ncbi:MAG: hypothetical protein N2645_11875 [Clostridia bacterium]|nr:hypothetical protein [Clostridia bacterium]
MQMDYKKIESLKLTLLNLSRQGCRINIPARGVTGKVISVGFKPYWTSQLDSKIEKLEINIMDDYGRIIPYLFYNVIGFDVISEGERGNDSSKNASLDIHVYSAKRNRDDQLMEKVRIDMFTEF